MKIYIEAFKIFRQPASLQLRLLMSRINCGTVFLAAEQQIQQFFWFYVKYACRIKHAAQSAKIRIHFV